MRKLYLKTLLILALITLVLTRPLTGARPAQAVNQALSNIPYFRQPVVPGAAISGYFDHDDRGGRIMFYDGRFNEAGSGFYFSCNSPNMWDWVGCEDGVSGELACSNARELWYDNHHGIDYEFATNWHTGATCNPGNFDGLTKPIYAPAAGRVLMAGEDQNRPANGWHIRIMHDLNGNSNYNDDNLRSIYLHFTAYALAVSPGQIVNEGTYLGLGGSTGYSSSPHLHFEVQRSVDNFQSTYWPVDPYGWQGPGSDPYPYLNDTLWRVNQNNFNYVPLIFHSGQSGDPTVIIQNGGFESGAVIWAQQGVDIIANTSHPRLNATPYQGTWLGWLGGLNNANDVLSQNIQVSGGQTNSRLTYTLRVDTQEASGVYDVLNVSIKDAAGNRVVNIETVDNTFTPAGQWVVRVFSMPDLSGTANQPLRLVFEAATDSNLITSFYIDEVTWTTSGP